MLGAALAATAASVYSLLQDEEYSATARLSPPAGSASQERAGSETLERRARAQLRRRGDSANADVAANIEVRKKDDPPAIEIEATAGDPRIAARVANTLAADVQVDRAVLDKASPPSSPSSPKPVRNTVLGGLAGLVLGLGLALVRGTLDRRLLRLEDLEEALDLPILAVLPESDALRRRHGVEQNLPPAEIEAFRALATNVCRSWREREIDSVLVTSPAQGDGKTAVAFNLAAAAAASGQQVLLIEARLDKPVLARALGLPRDQGLASVIAGETPLLDACHEVLLINNRNSGPAPAMDVLPAGEMRPSTTGQVDAARMREIVHDCRRNNSLVVIDAAPSGALSRETELIGEASAVVVVGRMGKLTSAQADDLRDWLESTDAPTLGVVANFAAPHNGLG